MNGEQRFVRQGPYSRTVGDVEMPAFSVQVTWRPGQGGVQITTKRSTPFKLDGESTTGIGVVLDAARIDSLIESLREAKRSFYAGGPAS